MMPGEASTVNMSDRFHLQLGRAADTSYRIMMDIACLCRPDYDGPVGKLVAPFFHQGAHQRTYWQARYDHFGLFTEHTGPQQSLLVIHGG